MGTNYLTMECTLDKCIKMKFNTESASYITQNVLIYGKTSY